MNHGENQANSGFELFNVPMTFRMRYNIHIQLLIFPKLLRVV